MAAKKLGKKIEGSEIIFTVGDDEIRYNTAELPEEIRQKLVPFGCGHKLGDAAASAKTPEEIVTAIDKVWNGMVAGNWTTRVPGEPKEKAPKINLKTILENLAKLPEEQQEVAKTLLASMGITL